MCTRSLIVQKWSLYAALPKNFAGCKEPWCSRAGLQPVASFDPLLQTTTDREARLTVTYSSPIQLRAMLALADEEEKDLSRFVLVQSAPEEKQVRVLVLLMLVL